MTPDARHALHTFLPDATLGERLPAGENEIYRVRSPRGEAILRLSPSAHRSGADVRAEIDFVAYLCERGYPAAAPRATPDGELVLPVAGGHACLFDLAPGAHVEAFGPEWNEALFTEWGRSMAGLHHHSASYPRAEGRFRWDEEPTARWMSAHLDGAARDAFRRLAAGIRGFADEMLIIHGDLGRINFHLHEGRLFVFDFDDCVRHLPMADVAVALWPLRNKPPAERQRYLGWMLQGYAAVRPLNHEHLQMLFEWRTLYMFAHHLRKWGAERSEQQGRWLAEAERQIREPVLWALSIVTWP